MTAFTVIAELDELLKPLRFTRKKMVWNRLVGRVVDVVDIQISKAGDTITVNTGVLDRDVHAKLWNEQPPSFVQEPSCTVRARVGELINGHDRWWPLNKTEPALQVSRGVHAHVLPFLERMQAREAMEEWLVTTQVVRKKYPPPILSLAILMGTRGKFDEACALLADLRSKSFGAWRARCEDVAKRLGCASG